MSNLFTRIFCIKYGMYLCYGRLILHQLRIHLHPSLYRLPVGERFSGKKILCELSSLCLDPKIRGKKTIVFRAWFISQSMETRLTSINFLRKAP